MTLTADQLPPHLRALVSEIEANGQVVASAIQSSEIVRDFSPLNDLRQSAQKALTIPALKTWAMSYYNHYADVVSSVTGVSVSRMSDSFLSDSFKRAVLLAGLSLVRR